MARTRPQREVYGIHVVVLIPAPQHVKIQSPYCSNLGWPKVEQVDAVGTKPFRQRRTDGDVDSQKDKDFAAKKKSLTSVNI